MHHDLVANSHTSKHLRLTLALLALCICGLLSAAGCGSGAYAEKFDKRLTELRNASPFLVMTDEPTDDLAINFRVPRAFTECYDRFSAHPGDEHTDNKRTRLDRLLPPFLPDKDGFCYTFEAKWIDPSDQAEAPLYLYVWEHAAAKEKHLDQIRGYLRARLGDPKADWEAVSVPTPTGGSLNWKKLHLHGMQSFAVRQNGVDVFAQQLGVFEAWLYEAPNWEMILAWRTTDKAWDAKINDVAVKDMPALTAGTIVLPPVTPKNRALTAPAKRPQNGAASPSFSPLQSPPFSSPPIQSAQPGGSAQLPGGSDVSLPKSPDGMPGPQIPGAADVTGSRVVQARLSFRTGLTKGMSGIAVSADQKYVIGQAPYYHTNNVQIWSLETGQKTAEISATGVDVPVAASPDGKMAAYIAQQFRNSTIDLVDLASGAAAGHITEHVQFVMSGLSFSPKGDLLVAASESELVGWDVPSGSLRFAAKQQGPIRDVSNFFDGGAKLALAEDGQIVIWDVAGGKAIQQLPCADVGLNSKIAVNNDGRMIAVKRTDWRIGIWQLTDGLKLARQLETSGAHGGSIRILPDGKTVAFVALGLGPDARVAGREMVCLASSETGQATCALVGPKSRISSLAVSNSGQALAAGGDDGSIYVWDVPAGL